MSISQVYFNKKLSKMVIRTNEDVVEGSNTGEHRAYMISLQFADGTIWQITGCHDCGPVLVDDKGVAHYPDEHFDLP